MGGQNACRSDVKCDVTGWEELGDCKLKVSWRFNCILGVPWKPILAAAGASLASLCNNNAISIPAALTSRMHTWLLQLATARPCDFIRVQISD